MHSNLTGKYLDGDGRPMNLADVAAQVGIRHARTLPGDVGRDPVVVGAEALAALVGFRPGGFEDRVEIWTTMRAIAQRLVDEQRPGPADLRWHLLATHCNVAAVLLTEAELIDNHDHEHRGPCTIRNHDRQDLNWDPAEAVAVLTEAIAEEEN